MHATFGYGTQMFLMADVGWRICSCQCKLKLNTGVDVIVFAF